MEIINILINIMNTRCIVHSQYVVAPSSRISNTSHDIIHTYINIANIVGATVSFLILLHVFACNRQGFQKNGPNLPSGVDPSCRSSRGAMEPFREFWTERKRTRLETH